MAAAAASSSDTGRNGDDGLNGTGTETKAVEDRNPINGQANPTDSHDAETTTKDPQKKSKIGKLWAKLDLDLPTALMMMKAALPPTISLAMYQADAIATTYSTLGYLVAIISILGFCIMPRAKFIQTMIMNVISTCVAAAVGMLMLWSGVQARLHTTPTGAPFQRYNSSQSVVCAVWLFFQIWLVNSVKAKFPQFAFPTILYAIFVNVAATYGPQFMTTVQAESFIKRLLYTFLTGFGLATGVSLLIVPVTCRKVVTKEMTGYIMALKGALQAHKSYLQSLETTDIFSQNMPQPADGNPKSEKPTWKPEIESVKKMTAAFTELHGKLNGDLPFAKRETVWGKLTPEDFEGIFKHLRAIMIPLVGLGSLIDIFDRFAESNQWGEDGSENTNAESVKMRQKAVSDWNEIMKSVHEPFATIIQAMDGGLDHALLRLQFIKPPKKRKAASGTDPEEIGDLVQPGETGFVAYLEKQSDSFYQGKETTLRHWIESKGVKLREDIFHNRDSSLPAECEEISKDPHSTGQHNQRQLYLALYIMFLLHSISRAILDFAKFADEKDQALVKSRLINPGKKRLKKWLASTFTAQDSSREDETTVVGLESNGYVIYMGEAYRKKKDPEHLPPQNAWEKFGNLIRALSGFLRSPESSFGFRCACATMSIAIVAYLRDTQKFFVEQRLVWAMIMVAISMVPTSGQSVYTFILRIVGTVIAMIVAFLIWFIPDEKTAGIIVFLWVFVALGFYIPLKRIDLVIVGLISVVTATMIVGYELEVRKIGRQLATSNGQPYYKIHLLGPYRLATVVGGLAVAFFWTFFPYPVSEHSALRQKLGGALYLSANYYSIMHETVMARIRGDEGDPSDALSPASQLTKARNKVFAKQMLTLQGLKMHSEMVKWEFPLGGKFPQGEYDIIIQCVSNIVNYTALIGYASNTFTQTALEGENDKSSAQWFRDFKRIISSADITSHEITSLLSLLSSSITNGQPLPPYLVAPQSYKLATRMKAVDRDILSIRHIAEPGYAAFAVMQISTRCIHMEIEKLLSAVKKLVGELDFSFHTVSTQSSSEANSTDTLVKTSSRSKQE
ncbi:hypothetical protein K505DRAFT_304300 [Melanomma pulvis-pyrius CBS 109.77]|uniref:ER transporter 6TM N-terminal domain-containing protein n=1 Tax=Melanomma pulvis-pyrius CBS 109.77 TaxID=1314802 RepID=A0A6A6XE32_9PLEO|nr:hypothetical protein K505DRAFT_304300 [Melanomma pulvis-pyrius CBS 109.77]